MVLKMTVGNFFTRIHICQSILTRHSQPSYSKTFKAPLEERGYPKQLIETTLSEDNFSGRQSALKQKAKTAEKILPFVTTHNPTVSNRQAILTRNWSFIENQLLLANIFKKPPYISYKRGRSLKDMLIRQNCELEVS